MEPAQTIIRKLGGPTLVAKALGLHRTRVSNWRRPKRAGGTDGVIPQKHITRLLVIAAERGIALSPADFFPSLVNQTLAQSLSQGVGQSAS